MRSVPSGPNGDVVTARAGGFPVGDEYCLSGGARAGGAADCVPVGIIDAQDLQLRGLEPHRQAGLGPEPDGVLLTLFEVHAYRVLVSVGVPVVAEHMVHLGS